MPKKRTRQHQKNIAQEQRANLQRKSEAARRVARRRAAFVRPNDTPKLETDQ